MEVGAVVLHEQLPDKCISVRSSSSRGVLSKRLQAQQTFTERIKVKYLIFFSASLSLNPEQELKLWHFTSLLTSYIFFMEAADVG